MARVSWIDCDGPLVPFARGYRQELLRLGHPPGTVKTHMVLAGQLNRWLCAEGFSVSHLTPSVAETFLATRQARDQRRVPTLASLALLFEYLKRRDALPPEHLKTVTTRDETLARYGHHLVHNRGLRPTTVRRYESFARRFLAQRASRARKSVRKA